MKIETAQQLADACRDAVTHRSLYVYGCFGAPMTAENQDRAIRAYAYNRSLSRQKKIRAATPETFGFDCSGLIKGLLWGWEADASKAHGGAVYGSNHVPDQNADTIIGCCSDVSEDFGTVLVGEAVWLPGHIGIYVGDGLAVESSPKWGDGVQVTACNCKKEGYHTRNWKKHGKLPYVTYEKPCSVGLPALHRGMTGETVKTLQRMLFAMGYPIGSKNPVDGSFGPKTEAAVCSFQKEKRLDVNGRVDTPTWKALLGV